MRDIKIDFKIDESGNFEATCIYKHDLTQKQVRCSGNVTVDEDYKAISNHFIQFMKSLEAYSGNYSYFVNSPSK